MQELQREIQAALRQRMKGEVSFNPYTRVLYSTDGSIYQIDPLGVAFPQHDEDLFAIVEVAANFKVPIVPRGAGTSLAGQVLGQGLVVDCSRHLNKILDLDPEQGTAWVEPGVVCAALNRATREYHLMFGTEPSSSDRASMGGIMGNNATGAHSIRYGMSADHLVAADVVLSDGSGARFETLSEDQVKRQAHSNSLTGRIVATALDMRQWYTDLIQHKWPKTWRRASGYNLDYLTGYTIAPPTWHLSPAQHLPGGLNLAPLLAGSEGTLALFRKLEVNLVRRPAHKILVILGYDSVAEACDASPELLELHPYAIELIPASILDRALTIPAYSRKLSWLRERKEALLAVEFDGETEAQAVRNAAALKGSGQLLRSPEGQAEFWAIRKAGLGLLLSLPGDTKPITFIEDLSVPVESLGAFVREVDAILAHHGTHGEWYGHASAGCVHLRPLMNLKTSHGVTSMRDIAESVAKQVTIIGGALSGEHGDGLSRTEFNALLFGSELMGAFRDLKIAFDPHNRFNPGKIVCLEESAPPLMDQNLRYGPSYVTVALDTQFAFRREGDLAHAVEDCVGAGVCRKEDGLMCPSYQATRREQDLTRGRANALRAALSGALPPGSLTSRELYEIFDLCLECKGCKAECPTGVDIARVKAEFLAFYQAEHGLPLRSKLFGEIHTIARLAQPFAGIVNTLNRSLPMRWFLERFVGISRERKLPAFRSQGFRHWFQRRNRKGDGDSVVLFVDTYSESMVPEIGRAAVEVLEAAGYRIILCKKQECCGRPMISKGMLSRARRVAAKNLELLAPYAAKGLPILGLEPSCILTLRDEYLEFFPQDSRAEMVASQALLIEEFLAMPGADGSRPIDRLSLRPHSIPWLLHGHCYAKALVGIHPTLEMLRASRGELDEIPSGCCGMAGSFGYEVEHTKLSYMIGELKLFPAVRKGLGQNAQILTHGFSCRTQIHDGTGADSLHPIQALAACLIND